jgi:TPR repeat protein
MFKTSAIFLLVISNLAFSTQINDNKKLLAISKQADFSNATMARLEFDAQLNSRLLGFRAMYKGIVAYNQNFYESAFGFFKIANGAGLIEAQYFLGSMYLRGEGVKKNQEEGLELLRKATKSGHKPAARDLGLFYLSRRASFLDLKYAKTCFKRYGDDPDFLFYLGLATLHDEPDGLARGRKLIKEAKEKGSLIASKYIENTKRFCIKIIHKENSSLLKYINIKNADRFFNLIKATEAYKEKKYKESFNLFDSAFRENPESIESLYFMGHMFLITPNKDKALGAYYLNLAMKHGYKSAAFDLGVRYSLGQDVIKNLDLAELIFARYNTDPKFQYHRGLILRHSYCETDKALGLILIQKAALGRYDLAEKALGKKLVYDEWGPYFISK